MAKLKFGSPAWRKKYMKAKRKPAKRKNAARRIRPASAKRAAKRSRARGVKRATKRMNPPKLKRLTKSTGWMNARRVKIVRKGRGMTVLVEKR